jgi:hypothetical protein
MGYVDGETEEHGGPHPGPVVPASASATCFRQPIGATDLAVQCERAHFHLDIELGDAYFPRHDDFLPTFPNRITRTPRARPSAGRRQRIPPPAARRKAGQRHRDRRCRSWATQMRDSRPASGCRGTPRSLARTAPSRRRGRRAFRPARAMKAPAGDIPWELARPPTEAAKNQRAPARTSG